MPIRVENKKEHIRPHGDANVTVKECGNIVEVVFAPNSGVGSPVRKINKDLYVDIRDGSVHEFDHNRTRLDDKISVQRSFKDLRDIVNTNCTDISRCLFITLTYAKNMTNPNKLYNDFKNFRKRFKCYYDDTEYILVVEPQARGAWHGHLLLIFPSTAPFIPNATLANMWKQGFVRVSKLDNVDNVGAYLTAYLADIPLDEAEQYKINPGKYSTKDCVLIDDEGNPISKRYLKGARLSMYPAGMRIFRCSSGIKKPNISTCREIEARSLVEGMPLTYESTKVICNEDTGFATIVNHRYYNKSRKELL